MTPDDPPPPGLVDRAYSVGGHATDAAPPTAALPDRRGLIRALGIVQIVFGGLCVLLTGGIVLALKTPASAIVYAAAATNLLVTGIGSVRLLRAARRATIISAAIWLAFVGIGLVATAYVLVAQRGFGATGRPLAMGLLFASVAALFVLALPVVLIVAYTRPSVRATFERPQAS
jgi:hypothetical protein